MATREENLKKINEQLEQLSDDELEKIAGGHFLNTDDECLMPVDKNRYNNQNYGHAPSIRF